MLAFLVLLQPGAQAAEAVLRAGAYAQDITPTRFPVVVNGSFLANRADRAHDPLHARAIVLDDGGTRLAIVVVDSCLIPRAVLDEAKELAAATTSIAVDRMLISATHTHSAPSVMACLGTPIDPNYTTELPALIAQAIERAAARLEPAKVGSAVVQDHEHTHNRRWIRRPDRIGEDPFGERTIRAMMHPGHQNPDYIGPSGPVDPDLTLLSIQSLDGRPIALLANYSMHYFGAAPLSADYYGVFCRRITELIGADSDFVAAMSQGTSGDLMWLDYSQPANKPPMEQYADGVAQYAVKAYRKIEYRQDVSLAMAERLLKLNRRLPDEQRVAWARQMIEKLAGGPPKTLPDVYALQQLWLLENPTAELKLQAVRIGDLGITAIPNEVFAITGLKLKAASPLKATMNIELANGAEGYIPPPEQHALGGYTTWACSTAGLEVQAEPRIVEAVLELLETVAGASRRSPSEPAGPYAQAVLASKPAAYWRMATMGGGQEVDIVGQRVGRYEGRVAYYLPGAQGGGFSQEQVNRSVHFAGGRMVADVPLRDSSYSIELWFWNGLPSDARTVTGYLYSRTAEDASGDHLMIGGTADPQMAGKLLVSNRGAVESGAAGNSVLRPKTWNHLVLARDGDRVRVYLNGSPEIDATMEYRGGPDAELLIASARAEDSSFEGKIDEVAVYDRALSADEVAAHFAAAQSQRPNIIVLLADDLGWSDLGCYGSSFNETPNIDRLAAQGLRFTSFYAAAPVCSPTRASIVSGQYPARTGITDFIPGYRRPFGRLGTPATAHRLDSRITTMAEMLHSAGYATGYFGKWHLGDPEDLPSAHGFETSVVTIRGHFAPPLKTIPARDLPRGTHQAELLAQDAKQFMRSHRDRPFFLMLSFAIPHTPLQARDEIIRKYAQKPSGRDGVGNPIYAAMLEHLDQAVGGIMDELDHLLLAGNTVLVFTSDNGALSWIFDEHERPIITSNAPLRGQKGSLYEGGIRVPLIVRWPRRVLPGTTTVAPTVSCDLLPTFAEIADVHHAPLQEIDGVSLVPLLHDPQAGLPREAIYFHYPHYHTGNPAGAIRAGRWKLIESFQTGKLELYDLENDPSETHDLARQELGSVQLLHARLDRWRQSVGAKLPVENAQHDAGRADELWTAAGTGPLDQDAIARRVQESLAEIKVEE